MGFIKTNNKTYTLNDKINDINRDIGESYLQDQISNIDVNSINELKLNLNNESESRINSDWSLFPSIDRQKIRAICQKFSRLVFDTSFIN